MVHPNDPFPVEQLKADHGFIGARVALDENDKPILLWECRLQFEPLELGDESYSTNLIVMFLAPSVRSLDQLVGFSYAGEPGPLCDGTFYLHDHRECTRVAIRIISRNGATFRVRAEVIADVGDSYVDPTPPVRTIRGEADLHFSFIQINARGLGMRPDPAALDEIVRSIFNTSEFAPPRNNASQSDDVLLLYELKGK